MPPKLQSSGMTRGSNPLNATAPSAVTIPFSPKALAVIEAEAKARRITTAALMLAALSDFLGRSNRISGSSRVQPLVLHLNPELKEKVVAVAKARGETVNRFVCASLNRRANWEFGRIKAEAAVTTSNEASETVVASAEPTGESQIATF
jgi:hypothetical protein